MKFKKLSKSDKDLIIKQYSDCDGSSSDSRLLLQNRLANHFNVSPRSIRGWANKLGVGLMKKNIVNPTKIMVYDIETSRVKADVWWSGKQFVHSNQIVGEPKIITIAWKWLGEDEVYTLSWDKNQCDKKMLEVFLKEYNSADMVIGQNNDKFDNRWINARAMKHNLFVNIYVKSFDIMKQAKKHFRIVGYSMDFMTKFSGVEHKKSHEGIVMWQKIQEGTDSEKEVYLQKMLDYNVGDIISTEAMYYRFRKYFNHKVHLGVASGGEKYSCPECGGSNIDLFKTTWTAAGTVQHIMICNDDQSQFKISHRDYLKFIDNKI